jgi:hypothetical protein
MGPRSCRSTNLVGGVIVMAAVCCFLLAASASASNPVPTVVGPPVPQAVIPGSGGFTLTVYGANFVSGAVVNWNRSPRSTTFISARELKAQILASDVATATAGCITVTNPPPGGGVSSSSYGLVEVHKPTKTINAGQPHQYLSGDLAVYMAAADFTHDGKLDLVAGASALDFIQGNGDGTFLLPHAIAKNYYYNAGIAFGDFNGDGDLDVLYGAGDTGMGPPTYIRVLLGRVTANSRGSRVLGSFPMILSTGSSSVTSTETASWTSLPATKAGVRVGKYLWGMVTGRSRRSDISVWALTWWEPISTEMAS